MSVSSKGTVARVLPSFGFIRSEDGVEYFFLPSAIQKTSVQFDRLAPGQRVQFVPIQHPKGPRAIEIKVI